MGWSFRTKNPGFIIFYNRKIIINKLDSGLTGTTIEQLDYVMKNNPDASVLAEVANPDAYLTADKGKLNEEDDDVNISDK